jgi:hypothetical protein
VRRLQVSLPLAAAGRKLAAHRGGAPIQFPISKKLKIGKTMPFLQSQFL